MSKSHPSSSSEPPGPEDEDMAVVHRMVTVLHDTRMQKGLTLRQVAGKMKVDNTHLSRVERGLVHPGLVILIRWCRALDLKPDKLLKDALEE